MKKLILQMLFYVILLAPMWIWIKYSVGFDDACIEVLWLCYCILIYFVSDKISCWFTRKDDNGYGLY